MLLTTGTVAMTSPAAVSRPTFLTATAAKPTSRETLPPRGANSDWSRTGFLADGKLPGSGRRPGIGHSIEPKSRGFHARPVAKQRVG